MKITLEGDRVHIHLSDLHLAVVVGVTDFVGALQEMDFGPIVDMRREFEGVAKTLQGNLERSKKRETELYRTLGKIRSAIDDALGEHL